MTHTIAIDFGTSRTKAVYLDAEGKPDFMRFFNDAPYVPSLFYLPRDSDRIFWGHEAEDRLGDDPAGIIDVLKRKLREPRLRANRRSVTPLDLLALLLRELREQAGREIPVFQGIPPEALSLTLPALFGSPEERLLRDAAAQAGFDPKRVELIPEPIAAARAWLSVTGDAALEVVVLDCGGGTIDWAYLRREDGGFHIVSECPPGGDRHLGGYDVDLDLFGRLLERLDPDGQAEAEDCRIQLLEQIRNRKERYCLGRSLDPIKLGERKIHLPETDIQVALDTHFSQQVCDNLNSYLQKVRALTFTGQTLPPVLLVGGSAKSKGLKEAIEKNCGCETRWWNRSEYATVLGAIVREVVPSGKDAKPNSMKMPASSLSPKLARSWYWHAPEYREYLRSLDLPTVVYGPNGIISEIDGNELFQAGLVRDVRSNGREIVVCLGTNDILFAGGIHALLAAGRLRELTLLWEDGIKADDERYKRIPSDWNISEYFPAYLREFLVHGDVAEAIKRLPPPEKEDVTAAVFLAQICDKPEEARRHLKETVEVLGKNATLETDRDSYRVPRIINAAKCWMLVLGDELEARKCLEAAPSKRHAAEAWLALFDDEGEAYRCLEEREAHLDNAYAWVRSAWDWFILFGDTVNVRRCLNQAEAGAKDGGEWIRCAEAWQDLLFESDRARHSLEQAEAAVSELKYSWGRVGEWVSFAEAWKRLLGDESAVARCLEQAEKDAQDRKDPGNWCECAAARKELLGDVQETRRCLEQAETTAKDANDWSKCAELWHTCVEDRHRVRDCLQQAEAETLGISAWLDRAKMWKELLDDTLEVQRCVEQAETGASSASDWGACAASWHTLLADGRRARYCMQKAEAATAAAGDWLNLASHWKELFGNVQEIRRCLEQAEAVSESGPDWQHCAEYWNALLGDEHAVRRCLKQAEALTDIPLLWFFLATAWKDQLADDGAVRRCLESAEAGIVHRQSLGRSKVFRSSDLWAQCARDWKLLLNDHRRACRCLRQAEATAESASDWSDCANVWQKFMMDQREADRCRKKAEALES